MKLSVQDQRALIIGLSDALQGAAIGPVTGHLPDLDKEFVSEEIRTSFKKLCGNVSIERFFQDRLAERVVKGGHLPTSTTDLEAIDGFQNTLQLAKSLVQELKTLPWKYKLYVHGPTFLHAGSDKDPFEIKISPRFGLVSSSILDKQHSFLSGNNALDEWRRRYELQVDRRRFTKNRLYFYYHYTGYIPIGGFNQQPMNLRPNCGHFMVLQSLTTWYSR